MLKEMYVSGKYLEHWPSWHVEISPWSARNIRHMMLRNQLKPQTICEVGCGAGEILKQLQTRMPEDCVFWGYEISPQALEIAKSRENERLQFELTDITKSEDVFFDLLLVIDVIEHVEDCLSFLRALKNKGTHKIFHIPLDLSARSVITGTIMQARERHGHLHYFTKDLAIQTLEEAGYDVLDYFYTSPCIDLPTVGAWNELRRKVMRGPRQLFYTLHRDLAVRVLGGWSLMVLTR